MGKIKKEIRIKVWYKYGKKCSYCGVDLKYLEMKVDHIEPIFRGSSEKEVNKFGRTKGKDNIENYNPSCQSCNSSKSTFTLEKWRKEIDLKKHRLFRDNSTFRILHRFNLVEIINKPIEFYFEKINYEKN